MLISWISALSSCLQPTECMMNIHERVFRDDAKLGYHRHRCIEQEPPDLLVSVPSVKLQNR